VLNCKVNVFTFNWLLIASIFLLTSPKDSFILLISPDKDDRLFIASYKVVRLLSKVFNLELIEVTMDSFEVVLFSKVLS